MNTWGMAVVDLNADLGEAETLLPSDLAILDWVTSANLSCGFHAGNPTVIQASLVAALERGVTIGAHVSYRDRQGYGRRPQEVPAPRLRADIVEQYEILSGLAAAAGGSVSYIKPHGALYHRMGVDEAVAAAVVDAVKECGARLLVAQGGTVVVGLATQAGLEVISEAFADRGYLGDGRLVPREDPDAVFGDPPVVARRAVSLVVKGGIEAADGSWLPVACQTLCMHGDTPSASVSARQTRVALEAAGVIVRSFAPRS
ncbi:MAG TPA: 5-oxoprolinase subunit PxpA [Acidimicrobiales bacterium]|nr:5-oxoprolinase subunit PxpA [Acidimicrobiales bacterium]